MSVVTGKAFWAKLDRAVNKFNPEKPRWSIDVSLDKDGIKVIKEATDQFDGDITINNKGDDRGDFVSFSKDRFLNDGRELPKPRLIDAKKNDISGTLLGNGSIVKVSFYPREWTFANKNGVKGVLKDVQVIELVEYFKDELEEEEGYEAATGEKDLGDLTASSTPF